MHYMERHGSLRSRPQELAPGTVRVISVRMDYWPDTARAAGEVLDDTGPGLRLEYALGRDYHKIMRRALARLAEEMSERIGPFGYRVCVDSAPVLEKALARNAGLGWIGKHTNLIGARRGSWFFLRRNPDRPAAPVDAPASAHCGTCEACIRPARPVPSWPPTGWTPAAASPISTSSITARFGRVAAAVGNRIYGCDDCQLVCP